ncbi:hypothetical protein MNBD_GAMMA22-302 [hydrothermal vent metagenome]|uniref:Cytochrome c domain-containing protein n=1 Tax=hydrothermal vent metagenome TaxID=652676 RepID=A0A3B0ZXT9_9ZZZZ
MMKVIKNLKQYKLLLLVTVALVFFSNLTSCYESNSEQTAPPPVVTPDDPIGGSNPGIAFNGKIYYQQNCSLCHAAGADDNTSAFGAIDLAKQESKVSSDMSQLDTTYNMMGRFNNIDVERVADLKKYLSGI